MFSIALYPRWVSLFFAKGVGLPDPHKRLKGSGTVVRHVVLTELAVLDDPQIRELMQQALARASLRGSRRYRHQVISARQRPRLGCRSIALVDIRLLAAVSRACGIAKRAWRIRRR